MEIRCAFVWCHPVGVSLRTVCSLTSIDEERLSDDELLTIARERLAEKVREEPGWVFGDEIKIGIVSKNETS